MASIQNSPKISILLTQTVYPEPCSFLSSTNTIRTLSRRPLPSFVFALSLDICHHSRPPPTIVMPVATPVHLPVLRCLCSVVPSLPPLDNPRHPFIFTGHKSLEPWNLTFFRKKRPHQKKSARNIGYEILYVQEICHKKSIIFLLLRQILSS